MMNCECCQKPIQVMIFKNGRTCSVNCEKAMGRDAKPEQPIKKRTRAKKAEPVLAVGIENE